MEDTICAVATSIGVGAISIIKVSGNKAISIVNSIFSSDIKNIKSHSIKYGYIKDNKEVIDEVLLMIMKAPKTYTKEDIVEINCHGGISATNKILELLLNKGCRLAIPGEFTKRAFLNGRINLLESEAVNELIKADTDSKRKLCLNQMNGRLTTQITNIREIILSLMANVEVNIDYPEYTDNLEITKELLNEKISLISSELEKLLKGSKYGSIVSNGINVAIVGKPNVGKSSILNHLLDEEKAIVTDVAGTTRDLVEGTISLEGIKVNLYDTAGIHETNDIVEKIGVKKSKDIINAADIVLLVLDGTKKLGKEDQELLDLVPKDKRIVFINKSDQDIKLSLNEEVIYGNTINFDGLDVLKERLIEIFKIRDINKDLTYLSNARQIDLIKKANKYLNKVKKAIKSDIPIDIIEIDLKECYTLLGEIIGDSYDEDVINKLFADFCVGK